MQKNPLSIKGLTLLLSLVLAAGAQALEVPLNWRIYPTVAEVPARARVDLKVQGNDLLVVVNVKDPDVARLRGVRRAPDQFHEADTSFTVYIDGSGTGKFARAFAVTHLGGMQDGTLQEGSDLKVGADFRWTAETTVLPDGWRATLTIPLGQLQISPGAVPRVHLEYRSMGEKMEVLSSGNPAQHGECQLCAGVEVPELVGQTPTQEWQLQPGLYALSGRNKEGQATATPYNETKATVTGSWRVNPQLELRGTVNPNYAEVEPDFPLLRYGQAFAPEQMEKRQFFARSTDLFETPGLSLVNTRSIALPKAALAAEYRSEGWRGVGLLAQDAAGGSQILPGPYGSRWRMAPASDSALFKGHWSGASSDAGVLLANRQYKTGEDNAVLALDGLQRFGDDYNARGLLSLSQSRVCDPLAATAQCERQDGHAARMSVRKSQSLQGYGMSYIQISPKFRSDLGWIGQSGFRQYTLDGFKRIENVGHNIAGISFRPQLAMTEDWQGQAIGQKANLEVEIDPENSGLYARFNLVAHAKERLSPEGALFNSRSVEGVFIVSPGVRVSRVAFVLRLGELPDYFNARAGQGAMALVQMTGALTSELGYVLTGQNYRTRARNGMEGRGTSYDETSLQANLNWQYAGLSRWRYVVDRSASRGQDIASGSPFQSRYLAHSLLWEHAPRQGLLTTAGLTRVQAGDTRTVELLLKAAYAF